ncbi:H(+)/Cl(-) exchange transporter ClcA [Posidoniimonas corsicana]|uniref:H(+)/Cl(-) exchange transporter ClcA n=1 Tax=Posidoniimonas corsicana TaxID=1938618 RepID=A0A5C5V6L1_9BACT|nr:chloride channel protein [Posidoniimonas corsicana]TWT33750.1 H(+)/Cl(-) exchange transporter ClcA [Posidoniimonas corsicana]
MPPSPDAADPSDLRQTLREAVDSVAQRGAIPGGTLTIILAGITGLLAGFGAVAFTWIIETITHLTYGGANDHLGNAWWWSLAVVVSPAAGLLFVSWFTRRFAPEAQGHGVPEVITAVARNDGRIRPMVALVKILASGVTIGTGGSVGREGPIVQIGSALGSSAGQLFQLSARNVKVLVAAGAAAGISATFNAPLAGVIFASEIILGSFAVESLTPIVLASVVADIVQQHHGEHRFEAAFGQLDGYDFAGAWALLPAYLVLGLVAGLAAVGFTKLVYKTEDVVHAWLPDWPRRAVVIGLLIGVVGLLYPAWPPVLSKEFVELKDEGRRTLPAVMGVGYNVVDHALHLKPIAKQDVGEPQDLIDLGVEVGQRLQRMRRGEGADKSVWLAPDDLLAELWWLLPLVLLKPLLTSMTLAGGGSGGVFAPSLYLGATLGACFGLLMNAAFPESSHSPGMYAIVGMGAVVAGTTHGVLSAILIVYEMTNRYEVILPIMAAAGLSSLIATVIDPESIYYKKLSRRGEKIARGHDLHNLDHIMVRDVMIRHFPTLSPEDNALEIIRIARQNPEIESLPVMSDDGKLTGIIRAEDLHRVLDSDISPVLVNAEDIALKTPLALHPAQNLIEAMRDFGARDVETLPVEVGKDDNRRLVGLLLRADVIKRYRQEMLRRH